MKAGRIRTGTGQNQGFWPVLLLLVAAVAAPTACVLWFMSQAIGNERLAVRQRLIDAYRGKLLKVQSELGNFAQNKLGQLVIGLKNKTPSEAFATCVQEAQCSSMILYDKSGRLLYPNQARAVAGVEQFESAAWIEAQRLEYQDKTPMAAGAGYARLAARSDNVHIQARALQAQMRCQAKAGQADSAVTIATEVLAADKYHNATDAQGRLIGPNVQLFALKLIDDPKSSGYQKTLKLLEKRVTDYRDSALSANQRHFLMRQLDGLLEEPDNSLMLSMLWAEDLAAEYLSSDSSIIRDGRIGLTKLKDVWQLVTPDRTAVALFTLEYFALHMANMDSMLSPGVSVKLVPPGVEPAKEPFLSTPAGQGFPNWHLALYLEGDDPFAAAADRQVAAYIWTALLVVLVIVVLALLVAGYISKQIKLTRLKNDLIATVSHELKTPLASMRVLVDTLLEGRCEGEAQAGQYLALIARENARLSRMIDNFLTFSRMERKKQAFEFAHVQPDQVIAAAVEAVGERFGGSACRLEVDVAADLPTIIADQDALVTVILNLLDNAYKYCENDRHIFVRAYLADGNVCFEVEDNGIGISRRACKKMFDRFWQADRSLSRNVGGCGLGLSIVKFIVEAHGGSIDVQSQPDKGSTFTVKLPVTLRNRNS